MTEPNNAPAPAPAFPGGIVLGYPRIGRMRELKKALESFWKGATSEADLETAAAALRAENRERLAALGLGASGLLDSQQLLVLRPRARRRRHVRRCAVSLR